MKQTVLFLVSILLLSCNSSHSNKDNYKSVIKSIGVHTKLIELTTNAGKSRITISPEIQGKILTSSYNGLNGDSNGWINYDAIKNSSIDIAGIGGEERIWLGPLGSQHSFYYQDIKPLEESNWKVPKPIGFDGYQVVDDDEKHVIMQKQMIINNHIGTKFNLEVQRKISILEDSEIEKNLAIQFNKSLKRVAYESSHSLVNIGEQTLKKETGLVSLWSAGMFEGTDETIIIIPLKKATSLDSLYKYMGHLDSSRLQIKKNNILLFKADGKYRSKIGIPKNLAPSIYGCYSKDKQRLTIIQYMQTNDSLYANSHATVQENPYKGEVIPIYNNGTMDYSPTDEHSFFELESTSAMRELRPSIDTIKHWHRVYHFSGDEIDLSEMSINILGADLKDCKL